MTKAEFLSSLTGRYKDTPDIYSEKEVEKIFSEHTINSEGYDNIFTYILRNYKGSKYPPVFEIAEAVANSDLNPHLVDVYYSNALTDESSKSIYNKWHRNYKYYTENSHMLSQKDEEMIKYNMLWSDMVYIYDKLIEIGWDEERIVKYCDRVCEKIRGGGVVDLEAFSAKVDGGINHDSHGGIFMRRIVDTAMGSNVKPKQKREYYKR